MMLLLGGTGLLGGQVLKKLREERFPVRLLTRGSRDWQDSAVQDVRQKGVEFIIADAVDREKLSHAAEGCTAIINLVGNMPPKPRVDLYSLHVTVAKNVLDIAKEKGIQRVIQVSCLGTDPDAPGTYLKTRYEADELVTQANLYWTVIRSSYIFGDRFPLLQALMPLVKFKLFLPIMGSGLNEMQPVHVDDVASCIVSSIYDKETVGKSFDLAGTETYTFQDLMEKARKFLKIHGHTMNIPTDRASNTADTLAKFLPKAAINTELLYLLQCDSITDKNSLETYFKRDPIPLETHFSKVMTGL